MIVLQDRGNSRVPRAADGHSSHQLETKLKCVKIHAFYTIATDELRRFCPESDSRTSFRFWQEKRLYLEIFCKQWLCLYELLQLPFLHGPSEKWYL